MFYALLTVFVLGYFFGYAKLVEYLENNHNDVYKTLRKENGEWYNKAIESLKLKTSKDKIEELEKQIEDLKED